MINTNKKWLLKASPWNAFSRLGIGMFLGALMLFGSQAGEAQTRTPGRGTGGTLIPTGGTSGSPALPIIINSGSNTLCNIGDSRTLTNSVSGGTWSSNNNYIATVNASGVVTAVNPGIAVITYTVGAQTVSTYITVAWPVYGSSSVCTGGTINLQDSTSAGIWTSSDPTKASVNVTGVVSGLSAGSVFITYTAAGCNMTKSVTVGSNAVGAISFTGVGVPYVCVGDTIVFNDTTVGGTWSSSNSAVGLVSSSTSNTGAIRGVAAGGTTITYTLAGGCFKTIYLNVNAPATMPTITPATPAVCAGDTANLFIGASGGVWSSANPAIATINAAGLVTGVSTGTAAMSYTWRGCSTTRIVSVNANTVTSITGNLLLCGATPSTLSATPAGGTWSTNLVSVATVGSATGIVTGAASAVSGATASIKYLNTDGCYKSVMVTVNASTSVGAMSGSATVCEGSVVNLSNAQPGGIWASSNTAVGTIDVFGHLRALTSGTTTISYTRLGCTATQVETVNALPTVTGTLSVCTNQTTSLSGNPGAGTWSNSAADATVGTVDPTGIVTGIAAGHSNITYTAGGCAAVKQVTVNGPAPISGGATVCKGPFMYLYLSDPTLGGTWTSSATGIATVGASTGVVTAVTAGAVTITYTAGGCYATKSITSAVSPGLISGNTATCVGSTTTLTDTAAGGTWTSGNNAIATVNATGVVSGAGTGATLISYTKNGCTVTSNITVGSPIASITGSVNVCTNLGVDTLTDMTPGGTWTASNPNVMLTSVNMTQAIANGASTGAVTVTYTVGGCYATKTLSVTANGATNVTGNLNICTGLNATLSSGGGAGAWTSADPSIASFTGSTTGTTAQVLGVSNGVTVITYTVGSTGCFKVAVFAVQRRPSAITGAYTLCNASTTTLTDSVTGGAWTSGDSHIALVSSTGAVTGVAVGDVTITYALTGGCETYQPIHITAQPDGVAGSSAVCAGSTVTMTNSVSGGAWTSTNPSVGSIDPTGIVTGLAAGTTTISYTKGACFATPKTITVGAVTPGITSAPRSVCALGSATTTAPTVSNAGGTWTSGSTITATVVGATGSITGVNTGNVTITYTLNGCYTTEVDTVFADTLTPITGSAEVCVANTITLNNATAGGTWTSSLPAYGSISAGGIVTGVAAGSTVISYSMPNGGCRQFLSVNVGGVTPVAITEGTNPLCVGATTTYTDATTGGNWTSSDNTVATINGSGLVTAIGAGNAAFTYTLVGCSVTSSAMTVNTLPAAIAGTLSVCEGSTTSLSDATTGGTWSAVTPAKGSIDAGGVVTGIAFGTTVIRYTLPTGCLASATATIGANGATLSGPTRVCGGNQITLTPTKSGGAWTSSNSSVSTVSGGTVTGYSSGADTIFYTTPGCAAAIYPDTVTTIGSITGSFGFCKHDSTLLANATSGGVWYSSDTTIAKFSIVTDGEILGIAPGLNIPITYTANGCSVSALVSVTDCGYKANEKIQQSVQVYSLFPNPGNGNITLTQSVVTDGAVHVSVMNYVGSVIYSGSLQFVNGKAELSIQAASGMYLVMLEDADSKSQTLKVLIEN